MRSIILMTFGKLANICFPTKVLTIDESDSFVSFFTCLMFFVRIESSCRSPICFGYNLFLFTLSFVHGLFLVLVLLCLNFSLFNWLSCNFVLRGDNSNFDSIWLSFNWNSFLHIIMRFLLSKEANNFVLCHAIHFFALMRDSLYKTNHCFVTLWIEFTVITSLNRFKFIWTILLWQHWELRLDSVLEICKETEAILKFNFEGLIVDCGPCASQVLLGTFDSIFAEYGLNLELVHELDLPNILLCKWKLVILGQYLEFVRQFVSANLFDIEQIDFVHLFTYVEVPYSVKLSS